MQTSDVVRRIIGGDIIKLPAVSVDGEGGKQLIGFNWKSMSLSVINRPNNKPLNISYALFLS